MRQFASVLTCTPGVALWSVEIHIDVASSIFRGDTLLLLESVNDDEHFEVSEAYRYSHMRQSRGSYLPISRTTRAASRKERVKLELWSSPIANFTAK
jgi:hypothetical protein